MYIIHTLLRFLSLPFRACASSSLSNTQTSNRETESLLESGHPNAPSLTTEYKDFLHSSRALRHCLLHAALYYFLAVLSFSFLLPEQFTIIDSLYFATVLHLTIGYGDLKPIDDASRIVTMFLAGYGIVILGLFLGVAGEWLVDKHDEAIQESRKELNDKLLTEIEIQQSARNEGDRSVAPSLIHEKTIWQEIGLIALLELPILLVVVTFALIIGHVEGWSILESVYWAAISGSTIGLGEIAPLHEGSRLACCFFLPFCVMVVGELLSRIAYVYMNRRNRESEHKFLQRTLTLGDIQAMDVNADGKVSQAEFLSYMLVALQKVEKEDVDRINQLFKTLDVTRSDSLTKEDIVNSGWNSNFRHTLETMGVSERAIGSQ